MTASKSLPARPSLESAVAQADRIIHDNDVTRLKELLAEYPALLSWQRGGETGSLMEMATGAYADAGDAQREEWFTRAACADVLIDAGAVVAPAVCEGILQSRARGLLELFQRKGLLLEHGANINTNWNSHEPASILHHLVFLPDPYESMQFLIDRGIDMTIRDYRCNGNAAGWARVGNNDEQMAQWLENAERQREGEHDDHAQRTRVNAPVAAVSNEVKPTQEESEGDETIADVNACGLRSAGNESLPGPLDGRSSRIADPSGYPGSQYRPHVCG